MRGCGDADGHVKSSWCQPRRRGFGGADGGSTQGGCGAPSAPLLVRRRTRDVSARETSLDQKCRFDCVRRVIGGGNSLLRRHPAGSAVPTRMLTACHIPQSGRAVMACRFDADRKRDATGVPKLVERVCVTHSQRLQRDRRSKIGRRKRMRERRSLTFCYSPRRGS